MHVALDTNILVYAEGLNGRPMEQRALAIVDRLAPELTLLPVQVLGELFNVLNHTNFRLPVSDISAPAGVFGHVQSDVSPRVIQVALKFMF